MKEATRKYMETAQEITREKKIEQYSLPHAHAWNGALTVLQASSATNKTKVETYVANIQTKGGLHAYVKNVKVFKLSKAYDKAKVKIE
eukprot:6468229-Amphidinium_carterae.1